MNKKIVIISGGELEEEFVLSILEKEENQYVIGVDKGMEFLYSHQILPNYIVGDFDSVKKEIGDYYRNETDVPIREFNPVKDASDTENQTGYDIRGRGDSDPGSNRRSYRSPLGKCSEPCNPV